MGHLVAGRARRPWPWLTVGVTDAQGDLVGLGDRGVEHLAVGVGDDDEVAADDGEAAVGRACRRVLDAVRRLTGCARKASWLLILSAGALLAIRLMGG